MSKYLAVSLMIVTLVLGVIGGYVLAGKPQQAMTNDVSKLETSPMTQEVTSGYTDQQFLEEMIMHHEQAIDMSKRVLQHTSRKEIKTMASDIIEVQTREIDQMKQWLTDWQ